jgi:hypothetical protein
MFKNRNKLFMKIKSTIFTILALLFACSAFAQNGGIIRGTVYDKESGDPIIFGTIQLQGAGIGINTDVNGFYSIGNVPPGTYNLVATYVGYDSTAVEVIVDGTKIYTRNLYMSVDEGVDLGEVVVSARQSKAKTDVQVSKITVSTKQIKSLPATGGTADIAQYLPVLPGIISSGDQGGQIYIRGGSPIQNKILLDGMTIYNPFHSIGFFSVFDTETIRSMDVLTGGFNAEYGGRISAIVDIKTREGNKKRFGGLVSANPFQANALFEGPLKKFTEGGGSTSFMFTAKKSFIDQTSTQLYSYATENDTLGLPYSFTDLYGKVSFLSNNGSKLNIFGFNFSDDVDFVDVTTLGWDNTGVGADFTLIPPNANIVMGGNFAFSKYDLSLAEADGAPRESGITSYSAGLNFTFFGLNNEIKYGFDFTGLNTNFKFRNFRGITFENEDDTSELSLFVKYKQKIGNLIIEPSLRWQYYTGQKKAFFEPRLGMKFNATDNLRFKLAGGFYSQNLISTVNQNDVVNLFVGFLTGPEEDIFEPGSTTETTDHNLQTAIHGIFGVEVDLTDNLELNVEPYFKDFTQLIELNRNRLTSTDPQYIKETGLAYGIDVSLRYETKNLYLWGTYSLGYVNRDDGIQEFPTVFDRRHNVNMLASYNWGPKDNGWEAGIRWNLGSGFPFTKTAGFYEDIPLSDGITTDYLSENGELDVIFDEDRNNGRLPYYHRLDISLKKHFKISKYTRVEAVASITNLYDRKNIFFFDRVRYERVNQLPILPSLGVTLFF